MAGKVFRQESKEFQLKVVWPQPGNKAKPEPGVTDLAIQRLVGQAIARASQAVAGRKAPKLDLAETCWRREGIRYDTAPKGEPGILKRNNLTLAVEAGEEETKPKCKQHHFVPELLFARPKDSVCYPDLKAARAYKQHDAKLKLEQDMHFSNIKFCVSGSVNVPGHAVDAAEVAFFSRYFPGLAELLPAETRLHAVSHWDEAVFDQMTVRWSRDCVIDSWMLVNRWQWDSATLLESELSFKVVKKMGDAWDYDQLHQAHRMYLALQQTGLFQSAPPIFFYDNPVSSSEIKVL